MTLKAIKKDFYQTRQKFIRCFKKAKTKKTASNNYNKIIHLDIFKKLHPEIFGEIKKS